MKINFIYTFNGREAECDINLASADPSVGILGPYIDEISATFLDDDSRVPDALIEAEMDKLTDLACDRYYDED